MMGPGIAVAVVPEEYYRKPKGVQFRKSFGKREEAIEYAETNSCRMVIACEAGDRYDVLFDPRSMPGSYIRFDLVVDRGELVAIPRPGTPKDELSELREAPASRPSQPPLEIAWNALHSWLLA